MLSATVVAQEAAVDASSGSFDWIARARALELAGDTDGAIVAWARSLLDDDAIGARRELARLTGDLDALRSTLHQPYESDGLNGPALSAAAGRIATGGLDVRVWDEATGTLVAPPIPVPAYEVYLDPTGERVALDHGEGGGSVWRVAPPQRLIELPPGWDRIHWSRDGRRLARCIRDEDGLPRAVVWDVASRAIVFRTTAVEDSRVHLALSHDGLFAVSAATTTVYDIASGSIVASGLPGNAYLLAFHPTVRRLMVRDRERGILRQYDLEAGCWYGPELACIAYPAHLASSAQGERWVVAGSSKAVASFEDGTPAGAPLERDDLEDWSRSEYSNEASALSPDGSLLAVSGLGGTARVWDTRSGQRLGPPLRHGAAVRSMCLTESGALVTACDASVIRVWSTKSLHHISAVDNSAGPRVHLGVAGSARALVVSERSWLERVAAGGKALWRCDLPARAYELSISADGSRLAVQGLELGLAQVDLRAAAPRVSLVSRGEDLWPMALDRTGTRLACADRYIIRVWDLSTGAIVAHRTDPQVDGAHVVFDSSGELWTMRDNRLAPFGVDPEQRPIIESPSSGGFDNELLAQDVDGGAFILAQEEGLARWYCDGRVSVELDQCIDESVDGAVHEWQCDSERVVAVQDDCAILIEPRAGRRVARLAGLGKLWLAGQMGGRVALVGEAGAALYNTADGALLARFDLPFRMDAVLPVPGSDELIYAHTDLELSVVEVPSGARLAPAFSIDHEPSCVHMATRTEAYVGTKEGAILRVDLASGVIRELVASRGVPIRHIRSSPDGSRIVFVEDPDRIVLWDTELGGARLERRLAPDVDKLRIRFGGMGGDEPEPIQFDPTGRWLLIATSLLEYVGGGTYNGAPAETQIVDAATGNIAAVLEECRGFVQVAQFSFDSERIVVASGSKLQTYETRTGRALAEWTLAGKLERVGFVGKHSIVFGVDWRGFVGTFSVDSARALLSHPDTTENRSYWEIRSTLDGEGLYVSGARYPERWFDLIGGKALENTIPGRPCAFSPAGSMLLNTGALVRWTPLGPELLGKRTIPRTAPGQVESSGIQSVAFVDEERVVTGARATPDGVAFDVLDFGPARDTPAEGSPQELLETWSVRLGLVPTAEGELTPRLSR